MIAKLAHRANGAVLIGLVLLSVASYRAPAVKANSLRGVDLLSDALWAGCKAQALKRITLRY